MRSPRSVKRPHTNHHTTNVRRNRGKQVKNSRMRHKQWAHTLIYSPDVAEKRQTFTLSVPIIKEVSDDERARRAEKKKEKKLVAKLNDDEARRLELERKEKEREERKQKREEERKRQEELEYQKWQEAQKKKEEELARAEAERKAAEKKAAEERKKEAAQAAQAEAKKEKAKKEKKQSEGEKAPAHTVAKVEKVTPTEAPTAPAQKPVEEHTKKKGGKGKKASETESGHHNDHNEPPKTTEVHIDEHGHGKREAHGKKGKKGKKAESESADVANGHLVNAAAAEPTHVIDSAPVEDVANGGLVQLDGEKKKGKGKKHETTSPEPSVVSHIKEVVEKVTTNEVSHTETNGHDEKHGHRSGEESSTKKNKHKEKKGKQISPETEITTKVTVTTEKYKSENDAPAATDKASPPIQVHEVTSTAHENGTKETVHTITTTITTSATKSPTQFAQNVERLVSHTLNKAKHDIVEIDPNVKMTIDAQLIKLSEKKVETTNDHHKIHITPLPLELHYSRPTTPSNRERVYKLLPRDIIFCSGLIDSHGEDYAAMAADSRNIYKENARAIQRKVRIFKVS
ncbi:hypothetical protein ANCCAN_02873 [Ancylostoma caninum]|uniref:Nucleolar protein 16 n=1 Tax=Ancylostoma caninum TaxID=29170 RepID=A0A368H3C9_ANCCA|nr:hypothetical protein ANCCAN_02873 [Ancylostoma caninum]